MTSRVLVVDDEPAPEALVVQKFHHHIRDGSVSFVFARDWLEALALIASDSGMDISLSSSI